MAAQKDYYKTLGVEKTASQDEIKKAFRRLARKHHPDVNPGSKPSEEKFKELNEAYTVLGDEQKRKEYDNTGKANFDFGSGGWQGGRAPAYEDIFEFGFGDIFGGSQGNRMPQKGGDLIATMEVTLEEAFTGTTKKMTYSREVPCTECAGSGAMETKTCERCKGTGKSSASRGFFNIAQNCPACSGTGKRAVKACANCRGEGAYHKSDSINVRIPAGVDNGSVVSLRGMGNAGTLGGPSGDLQIRIIVKRHQWFERKENDIILRLPVTFGEAAFGAKVEVPTIDGTAIMILPKGTQGGQRFKLKGKGFSIPKKDLRGDMYIDIDIAVPKELTDSAKEAVNKIEESYKESPRKGFQR